MYRFSALLTDPELRALDIGLILSFFICMLFRIFTSTLAAPMLDFVLFVLTDTFRVPRAELLCGWVILTSLSWFFRIIAGLLIPLLMLLNCELNCFTVKLFGANFDWSDTRILTLSFFRRFVTLLIILFWFEGVWPGTAYYSILCIWFDCCWGWDWNALGWDLLLNYSSLALFSLEIIPSLKWKWFEGMLLLMFIWPGCWDCATAAFFTCFESPFLKDPFCLLGPERVTKLPVFRS